jgi:hypothetical protein
VNRRVKLPVRGEVLSNKILIDSKLAKPLNGLKAKSMPNQERVLLFSITFIFIYLPIEFEIQMKGITI